MDDEARVEQAVDLMADEGFYRLVKGAGSGHPCPLGDCRLSVEELHRLVHGLVKENSELRKRLRHLEGSG